MNKAFKDHFEMEQNKKYKLLGFDRSGAIRANIMVLATGKHISIGLQDLEGSEIMNDFIGF